MRKKILWIGAGLLFLLAVFLAVPVVAGYKLDAEVAEANQGGHQLSIGKRSIAFRLTHFNLVADSIRFKQSPGGHQLEGSVDRVEINGLKILPLLFNDRMHIAGIHLDKPVISLQQAPPDAGRQSDGEAGPGLQLGQLTINDGSFERYSEGGDLVLHAMGMQCRATALQLPLAPAAAPSFLFQTDSLFLPKADKADWSINDLKVDTDKQELRLGTLRLSPRQAMKPYLTSLSVKDNWLALRMDDVLLENVPFDSLMTGGLAVFPAATIGDFNLRVFENPSLPNEPEGKKVFPVEQFRNLPFPVLLQQLRVQRANITYGVTMMDASAPEINFRQGNFSLHNFSTYPQPDSAMIRADFTFDEDSPLQARFALDQAGNGRDFGATGQLKNYPLTRINPFMSVAADAFIEGGHLSELRYNFSVARERGEGKLLLLYDGLELKLEGKGAWLKNILEDIAIRDSNPRSGGDLVHGTVYHEHEPGKSFFNLYWKSIVSGLKSSVAGKFFTPEELKTTER